MQSSHFYGIPSNSQLFTTFTASGGTVTASTNGNSSKLDISTSVGSYATERSLRVIKYRHGFGNIVRVGYTFQTGVANSLQFCGAGSAGDDLYFCMNGTDFGIRRSYGGLLEIWKLTVTAAATLATENINVTLNGTSFTPIVVTPAGAAGVNFNAHQIEIGGTGAVSYTGWNLEHIGDSVYFIGNSVGLRNGSYSVVNSTGGGTFAGTITQVKAGQALTTEFVPQADWNGPSTLKSTLDPTKNNLYEISYTWFGTANINFKVYNKVVGEFETVHSMSFANGDDYSLFNPNMYIQTGLASLGSTTAMTNYSSGQFGAILGKTNLNKQPKGAISNTRSLSAGVETVVLTIRNRLQINGFASQGELLLLNVSATADGNRPVVLKVLKNPTTLSADTTTDYTDSNLLSNDNLLVYDTTTLTYTGGLLLYETVIPKNGGIILDLSKFEIYLAREDVLIFTAESSQVNTFDIACTFISDI